MKRRKSWDVEPLEGRCLLSGVSATLTTDASSYQAGQPVLITYTETNNSNHPVSVIAGPSVDVFVVRQNGETVWQSNEGAVPMYLRTETLQPGQSFAIRSAWDGRENGDGAALSGTFVVSDQFQPSAPPATFQIAAPPGGNPPPAPPGPGPGPIQPVPPPAPIVTGPAPGAPGHPRHHGHKHVRRHVNVHAKAHANVHGHGAAAVVAPRRFSWIAPEQGPRHHG